MLTAELQFTVTFLKSQAILSLCHCDNGMDQILPADIIMEFNCLWHTLMKNVKPFSLPPCATTTHSRCPAWRCPYGRLVSVIFSLMSGELAVWKGCCGAIWRLRYKCIEWEALYLSLPVPPPQCQLGAGSVRDTGCSFTTPSPYICTHRTYLSPYRCLMFL